MKANPEPGLRVTYAPYASEHDLIYGYVYGCFLNGHGAEPWLVRPLSAWTKITEAELERRGLFKKAKRIHRILLKQHHQDYRADRQAAGIGECRMGNMKELLHEVPDDSDLNADYAPKRIKLARIPGIFHDGSQAFH